MTNYDTLNRTARGETQANGEDPSRSVEPTSPAEPTLTSPRVLARMPDVSLNETASDEERTSSDQKIWPSPSVSSPIYGVIGVGLLTLAILPFLGNGSDEDSTDSTESTSTSTEAPIWNREAEAENSSLASSMQAVPRQTVDPSRAVNELSHRHSKGITPGTTEWVKPEQTVSQDTSRMQNSSGTVGNASWPNGFQQMQPPPTNLRPDPWDTKSDRWKDHPYHNQIGQNQIGQTETINPQTSMGGSAHSMDVNKVEPVNATNYFSENRQSDPAVYLTNATAKTASVQNYDTSKPNYGSQVDYQKTEPDYRDQGMQNYNRDLAIPPRMDSQLGVDHLQTTDPNGYPDYRNDRNSNPSQTEAYSESTRFSPLPEQYNTPTARLNGVIQPPL